MDSKYLWHFNDKDYMKYAQNEVKKTIEQFNYKDFITPYDETRELIGKIIEEFQYLEACINYLLECAVENNLYQGKINFNFDKYNSATKIIKALTNVLIEKSIAKDLLSLVKFRNYIIHKHYLSDNSKEKEFPYFLFKILEANDYIANVTNRIIGGATHTPNIYEVNF